MKKYSITLLLLSLFLSIVLSVIIATSVNLRLDELGALWNVLLPPVLGLVTLILVLITFPFIKRTAMRKILLISFIVINILTGIILNIQFNRLLNYNKTVVSVKNDSKRDFHFASYVASDASVEEVTIKNKDGFLSNDHLTFSFLENKWRNEGDSKNKIKCNDNHDQVTIHIKNDRKVNLNITKVAFSKKGLWAISKINNLTIDESAFPVCVRPGNYVDVTVDFTADAINKRVESSWWKAIFKLQFSLLKVAKSINYELPVLTNCLNLNGVLYLYTDDGVQNVKSVYLNSLWQYRGEGDWEPDLQRVLYAFNIKTKVGFKYFDNNIDGERIVPNSDEIEASIFEKANAHLPVKITQIAAYHACCSTKESDTLKYYYQKDLVLKTLFHHDPGGAQILLPKMLKAPGMVFTEFDPEEPFGLQMGSSNTDRKKNYKNKIGLRIWKVINKYGKQVPDCYIFGGDYLGSPGTNYDYQDNVYFVQNIKPLYN